MPAPGPGDPVAREVWAGRIEAEHPPYSSLIELVSMIPRAKYDHDEPADAAAQGGQLGDLRVGGRRTPTTGAEQHGQGRCR